MNRWILPAITSVLALADGAIHLALDFILFHGRFFGSAFPPGPPPGAAYASPGPAPAAGPPPNPFILPLNELFLLNFLGSVVLVAIFLLSMRWLVAWHWLVDLVLIAYVVASIVGWLAVGKPNPQGLGFISKGVELVLIAALATDLRRRLGRSHEASRVAPAAG